MKVYEELQLENLIGEQWEEIEGYEGRYQISNFGRVKSIKNTKEKIMKQSLLNGYCRVGLSNEGKMKMHYVHRLVVEAFIGEITEGFETDHINGDRSDNVIDNLRIVTHYENVNNDITIKRMKNTARSKSMNDKKYMSEVERERKDMIQNSYYSTDIFYFCRNDYNYPSLSFLQL